MERKGWSGGEGRESMRFWELLLAGFLPSSGGSSLLLSVEVGTWDLGLGSELAEGRAREIGRAHV